jgi:DMSO/TMAO reductase YedYZ molybdopterin-dependent catalytic subunit
MSQQPPSSGSITTDDAGPLEPGPRIGPLPERAFAPSAAAGAPPGTSSPPSRLRRRIAAALAVAAGLGAQELIAGLIGPIPSLMAGVAAWVIEVAPLPIVEAVIGAFGSAAKSVLIAGTAAVGVLIGFVAGAFPRSVRLATYGTIALIAALMTARVDFAELAPAMLNAMLAFGVSALVDRVLLPTPSAVDLGRRRFLAMSAVVGMAAVAAALVGRALIDLRRVTVARREDIVLPDALRSVPPPTVAHEFPEETLVDLVTPNHRFFVVDINALEYPEVDPATWTLRIRGEVDREVTYTYADLLAMPLIERYLTLSCISNKVGGYLVDNAVWRGVLLRDLLDDAGVRVRGQQVVGHGADGFSTGFPIELAYDRDTVLAVGMNGEPLPIAHGFPARVVVPGLYGFVSATKWLTELELTGWHEFDPFWVRRGWDKEGWIQTQSRIDSPRKGNPVFAGERAIAGVAWAPHRGISKVEVRVDDGPWQEAALAQPLSIDTWVQWSIPWSATEGDHVLTVRATDGTGETQTDIETRPTPSGATGHHSVPVRVQSAT